MDLSIYRSIDLSIYLSIHPSICKFENEAILRDFVNFWTWQHQKGSNSARLRQLLNLTTSKRKQFCETSSTFELDNVKKEAILRDFVNFWTWQHQKGSNSARPRQLLNLITSKRKQFCETSSTFELDNIKKEAILRDFVNFWTWQHQKGSNSARLRQLLNLTTSKRKQFCETSSTFELDNIKKEAILRDFVNFWTWQHQKGSNSARLRQLLNLTTSKRKQFCETSSTFELDNIKKEAILRDFVNFWTWQHQKGSNSARLRQLLNLTTSKRKQFCETSSTFELDNIKKEAILRDFVNFWTWQHQTGSNSARLRQLLNLITSKRKQFCETSSTFELDNIKKEAILRDFVNFWTWQHQKEAILRDFVNFWTWQHQKGSNSARLHSIMESWVQSWRPRPMYQWVLRFFQSMCLKYGACREKVRPGHTKCCTCHTKSFSRNWRSDPPKCNPSQEISALTS